MKVIFAISSMAGGGSERVISVLANRFIKDGIEVLIMMTVGNEIAYQLDELIEIKHIGGMSGGNILKRIERIKKMRRGFKEEREAHIISFAPDTSFFVILAALFTKNRLIISERNDPAICPYPYRLRNLLYRRASCFVFQTEDAKKCFPHYIRKKSYVIANPLSEEINIPKRNEDIKNRYEIVAVGRLEPQKNHALLLESFAIFLGKMKAIDVNHYTLTIYGSGSLHDILKKRAESLGIADKVTFAGFHADIMEKIKNCAMYILSSDYEGISNSLLEAMAIGLPVISTDCPVGGSKTLICSGKNGILVPVGDAKALAGAICKLAENPLLASQMGKEAAKVRELYTAEVISKKWIELL